MWNIMWVYHRISNSSSENILEFQPSYLCGIKNIATGFQDILLQVNTDTDIRLLFYHIEVQSCTVSRKIKSLIQNSNIRMKLLIVLV